MADVVDRQKGLVLGLVGGVIGVVAMRAYWTMLMPNAFAQLPDYDEPVKAARRLPEIKPVVEQRNLRHEPSTQAFGRRVYERLTGRKPGAADLQTLGVLVHLVWGLLAGGVYGGTRTTTRGRDIAGGFFYGIRLWFGDEVLTRLLGLRPDPRGWSLQQHLVWLTGHWVYSFVTTNVTRVLYRLV